MCLELDCNIGGCGRRVLLPRSDHLSIHISNVFAGDNPDVYHEFERHIYWMVPHQDPKYILWFRQ